MREDQRVRSPSAFKTANLCSTALLTLLVVLRLLMRESNVVHISAPVTVVGDIHGSAAFASDYVHQSRTLTAILLDTVNFMT